VSHKGVMVNGKAREPAVLPGQGRRQHPAPPSALRSI
jgi:hypothetical protein